MVSDMGTSVPVHVSCDLRTACSHAQLYMVSRVLPDVLHSEETAFAVHTDWSSLRTTLVPAWQVKP